MLFKLNRMHQELDADYPMVLSADILITMRQEALCRSINILKRSGSLFANEDFAKEVPNDLEAEVYRIPANGVAAGELEKSLPSTW